MIIVVKCVDLKSKLTSFDFDYLTFINFSLGYITVSLLSIGNSLLDLYSI